MRIAGTDHFFEVEGSIVEIDRVIDVPEIITITDDGQEVDRTEESSVELLGAKAVEQAILSAADEQQPDDNTEPSIDEPSVTIPIEEVAPLPPSDTTKQPPILPHPLQL